MAIALRGTIRNDAGQPVKNAAARLMGTRDLLGNVPGAVLGGRLGELSWTRPLTGFSGHRWNCFQAQVMNQVSGITFEEFKDEVVAHNPHLEADGFLFLADKQYLLPEQAPNTVIAWDRTITNFQGHRFAAWETFVQGKVSGITFNEFKDEVAEQNPALQEDGFIFRADKTYSMPQNVLDTDEIAWTRDLTGFAGHRWACWEAHVQGRVEHISWGEFVDQVVVHNPDLALDGFLFKADKRYRLPENSRHALYYLFTKADANGQYAFPQLTTEGTYELLVRAEGHEPASKRLRLKQATTHDVTLKRPETPPDDGGQRVDTSGFIQAKGGQFTLNNQPFRFVGVNITGLVHYGETGDRPDNDGQLKKILPHTGTHHRDVQLAAARQMLNARVVRLFLADRNATTKEIIRRLDETLKRAEAHDVYLLVAFTDVHGDRGFILRDDEPHYTQPPDPKKLNRKFYTEHFRANYLPFVTAVVSRFKDNKRIFAWELGNEFKSWETANGQNSFFPDELTAFVATVSAHIKSLDPIHMVGTGIINSGNLGATPAQAEALARLPHVDFLTAHVYYEPQENDEVRRAREEAALAQRVGKPFIIEEFGVRNLDIVPETSARLREWYVDRKASAVMQWGFMAGDNIGDGDQDRGLDSVFRGQEAFDKVTALYRHAL